MTRSRAGPLTEKPAPRGKHLPFHYIPLRPNGESLVAVFAAKIIDGTAVKCSCGVK